MGLGTYTVAQTPPDVRDLVFQVSTLPALSAGVFDGDTTIAELKRHGNFGLGTFNGVDGEMIVLGGEVYQVKSDGKAQIAASAVKTPFAAVTAFSPDRTLTTDMPMGCAELETFISTLLPSPNTIYALRVNGAFETLKVRSEARQSPPYTTLAEVLGEQVIFDYQRLSGTMVGFWFPQYTQGVNATGYHFHFLSADKKTGGHVLDCRVQQAQISLDASNGLSIMLPDTDAFLNADLAE